MKDALGSVSRLAVSPALVCAIGLAWIVTAPAPALGQAGSDTDDLLDRCYEKASDLLIEIDSTGVADWQFTNRRRPYPVVEKLPCGGKPEQKKILTSNEFDVRWERAAMLATAVIRNTSNSAVVVTIPYQYRVVSLPAARSWLDDRLDRADQSLARARGLEGIELPCEPSAVWGTGLDCIQKLLEAIGDLPPEGASEMQRGFFDLDIPMTNELISSQALQDLRDEEQVARQKAIAEEARADVLEQESELPWSDSTERDLRRKQAAEATVLAGQARELMLEADAAEARVALVLREVLLFQLDRAVKAIDPDKLSWATLPPHAEKPAAAGIRLRDSLRRVESALSELWQAKEALGDDEPPVGECPSLSSDRQTCSWSATLYEGNEVRLAGDLWRRLSRHSGGVIEIKVQFFDESLLVTNPAAYLRVRSRIDQPGSSTSWKISGDVGYEVVPEVDRTPADKVGGFFTTEEPYDDGRLRKFTGTAKLELNQKFSSIAEARVVSQFKGGDLGEKSTTRDLVVPIYEVKITGVNGVSLRFGQRSFGSPGSGIAISESGEGFELNWRRLAIAHLVKRESLEGLADDDDKDTDVTLVRTRLPPMNGLVQSVELIALRGEDNTKDQTPYEHWTAGFEASLGNLLSEPSQTWSLTGTLAAFYSERDVEPTALEAAGEELPAKFVEISDGSGGVGLIELRISQLEAQKPGKVPKSRRTFALVHARGQGDDPATPEDEGYIGETNGFKPDKLFLGRLASTMREPLIEIPPEDEDGDPSFRLGTPLVRGGLSNKNYYGLTWVERQARFLSPLNWIARWLRVGDEIEDQATTLSLHTYRLDEPLGGRTDAGLEADLTFQIEVPKGVKTSLTFAQYWPGDATRPFVNGNVFSAQSSVSVSF